MSEDTEPKGKVFKIGLRVKDANSAEAIAGGWTIDTGHATEDAVSRAFDVHLRAYLEIDTAKGMYDLIQMALHRTLTTAMEDGVLRWLSQEKPQAYSDFIALCKKHGRIQDWPIEGGGDTQDA